MKKEFEHKEIEVCKLCHKPIVTDTDNWFVGIDYTGKNKLAIGFYHRSCYVDMITAKGEVLQKNFEEKLSKFTRRIFQNAGLSGMLKDNPPQEVVVIK